MSGIGWDILGLVAVGIGAAALVYAVMHVARKLGRPLPRVVLPASIGAAMLVFAAWNEYSWSDRVIAQLPPRVVVLEEISVREAWRPWTLAFPVVTRFVALDRGAMRQGEGGLRSGRILFVERWHPTQTLTLEVDCGDGRQRMLGPRGGETNWLPPDPSHPAVRAICDADLPQTGTS